MPASQWFHKIVSEIKWYLFLSVYLRLPQDLELPLFLELHQQLQQQFPFLADFDLKIKAILCHSFPRFVGGSLNFPIVECKLSDFRTLYLVLKAFNEVESRSTGTFTCRSLKGCH